jgi:hypothetical protein
VVRRTPGKPPGREPRDERCRGRAPRLPAGRGAARRPARLAGIPSPPNHGEVVYTGEGGYVGLTYHVFFAEAWGAPLHEALGVSVRLTG